MNWGFVRVIIPIVASVVVGLLSVDAFNSSSSLVESVSEDSVFSLRPDFSTEEIPNFVFVNQYGQRITQEIFADKIYVADFFFTTCPTICPVMAGNKYRIQEAFKNQDDVLLLSHSIDPAGDSVSVLRNYAERVGALPDKWYLVTGNRDTIYRMAREYYVTAYKDELLDNSFVHDGRFILIGKDAKVKGIYDGTDLASTQQLIIHIKKLLQQ